MEIKIAKTKLIDTPQILIVNKSNKCLNILSKDLQKQINVLCKKLNYVGDFGKFLKINFNNEIFILAGLGDNENNNLEFENFGGLLLNFLKNSNFKKVQLEIDLIKKELLSHFFKGLMLSDYSFKKYFSSNKNTNKKINFTIISKLNINFKKIIKVEKQLVEGIFFARDLVYEPANLLTPKIFSERCKDLRKYGVKVQIFDEKKLKRLGMNTLLAVGQGSVNKSFVVVMNWDGGGSEKPIAIVGKGVCFDTGGISLKPARGMEQMKFDMAGAAAVVGTMKAISSQKIKKNVVAVVGLVENMPGSNAIKPGDVIKSMSGKTIEIINTDAEGRLVLADILFYIKKYFSPKIIINLATLTGAIIGALGKEYAGLFCNDDKLADLIFKSGEIVDEKCWRMPLEKEYNQQLKSHVADLKNIGGPYAGSITAALFLQNFVGKTPWAHLDIAGVAWVDKRKPTIPSGGSGYGVKLLHNLIISFK